MRGYRFPVIRCARESVPLAMLVLARYGFVVEGSPREIGDGVQYTLDMARLPHGDADAAELMVMREVERAVSLHAVL